MYTSPALDDDLSHSNCGCGNCDGQDELGYDDEDIYDDPYEVVMFDIDTEPDDLYALIDMLSDTTRSWYARRRLNALAASGPLSALVADIIVDSLGRKWNPLLHPRDRFGRFIETGGFVRWLVKGQWLRGQISRIDSDGAIHVRSAGNDDISDGSPLRFKSEMASKMVSIEPPVADLDLDAPEADIPEGDVPDLDAEIPDFPSATPTQRRIYNALRQGEMPAEDLDVYRAPDNPDMPASDFAGEIADLEERGFVEIESQPDADGNKMIVRRIPTAGEDADAKAVIDVEPDEVPDDETPDLADSPNLTKDQRFLLDRLADADAGVNDGVRADELTDINEEDFQALIDAGALVPGDDDNYFLENPEGDNDAVVDAPVERDLTTEIFDAAAERLDDPDAQEAFQHYAEELARPGDENNATLPEDLAPAKRRNAQALAEAWWEERNAGTSDENTLNTADEAILDQREADDFADEGPGPKDVLNPRNQALADQLLDEWFPEEDFGTFLDEPNGVEYRGAIKRLFDAEDLEENGFDAQAAAERDKANRAMQRIDVPEEDIEGWPLAVQNARNAEREGAGEVAPDEIVPGEIVPDGVFSEEGDARLDDLLAEEEVLPEEADAEDPAPEDGILEEDLLPEEGLTVEPDTRQRWKQFEDRLNEEGPADEFYARLEQEAQIAEELGLDHFGEDAPWSWQNMSESVGYRVAELIFNDVDGSIGRAGNVDLDEYQRRYENELLQKFDANDGNFGPEVLVLRKAGLVEADGNARWRLTDSGRERLGLAIEPPDEEVDVEPDSAVDLVDEPGAPQNDQDRIQEEVRQNLIRQAQEPDTPAEDELQVEEVDLPDEDQIELQRQENYGNNDGEVRGERQFQPQNIPLLANEENWPAWEERQGAHEVAQAMWDAQNNILSPDEAYEVAASRVRDGLLKQSDLEKIQDAVKDHLEGRGQKWVDALEIDHVGDDQRAVPDGAADAVADGLVPIDASPEHAKAINQPGLDFVDMSNLSDDGIALDHNGLRVQKGAWYRADAGGEGDPGEMVGFYDQEKYPGLIALVMPDGKVKGVFAKGQNRITPQEANEWRAQRAVRNREQNTAGQGMPELDQFHRMLQIKDANDPNGPPIQAKLGQRVVSNSGGQKFPRGEEGVIVRFGWDGAKNRPIIFVVRPGAQGQRDEIGLAPKSVQFKADTPAPPTPDLPSAPGPVDLPDREWPIPGDNGMIDRLNDVGGEADLVRFTNAFQNPGVAYDQILDLINRGLLEREANRPDGRIMVRVPGGGQRSPDVNLPEGAENAAEARIIELIDAANGEGLLRSQLVNLDTDDVDGQFAAITALTDRGILERYDDTTDGRARYRRAPAAPEVTPLPNGAQNELEADLLNIIDGAGETGVLPDALVDIDADDAADRAVALRALVDRRVVQRDVPEDGGRPVYRRRQEASGTPVAMTDAEAAEALKNGVDPLTVANPNLESALRASGYKFARNQSKGRSGNNWAIAPDSNPGPFSVPVRGSGVQANHVYMIKQADPLIANSVLNEVMASVLNEGVVDAVGQENPGAMFLPRVGIANAPNGVGKSAGGAIIMDHAAYGYSEGHAFFNGDELSKAQKQANGASSSMIRLGLFDYLINNGIDRHSANQMFAKNPDTGAIEVLIIDNGFGFGAAKVAGFSEGSPFTVFSKDSHYARKLFRHAGLADRDEVMQIVRDFVDAYQQIDIEATIARLRAAFPTISASQEEYARKWFTEAKTRADALAGDIEGVVDTIVTA